MRRVMVRMMDMKQVEVDCVYENGPFGVTVDIDGPGWSVTHLATGGKMTIGAFGQEQAKDLCDGFAALPVDWSFSDPSDWHALKKAMPDQVWRLHEALKHGRIIPPVQCFFCHEPAPIKDDQLDPNWDLVWQSPVCPKCQPRVAADGGYGVVKGGAYAAKPRPEVVE